MTSADEIRTMWQMVFALAACGNGEAARDGACALSERLLEPHQTLCDAYAACTNPAKGVLRRAKLDRHYQ